MMGSRGWKALVWWLAWFAFGVCLAWLMTGCVQQERQRDLSTTVHRTAHETGTQGGQPYSRDVLEETTTATAEKTTTTTGLDPATMSAITGAISTALTGATAGTPVGSILALLGGGSGVAAIGAAMLQTMAKRKQAALDEA